VPYPSNKRLVDGVPTVPRAPWHHPEDKWQVVFAGGHFDHATGVMCAIMLAYPDPKPVRISKGQGDWEYGMRYGRKTKGPIVPDISREESYASLRRIV
jgi:hypothetical protein